MHNRGGPENPLSAEELRLKFTLNATRALAESDARRLADLILDLDRLAEVGQLVAATRPGAAC